MFSLLNRQFESEVEHGKKTCSQTFLFLFFALKLKSRYEGTWLPSSSLVFSPASRSCINTFVVLSAICIVVMFSCVFLVSVCSSAEENTWMVIQHNNTELTRVRPSVGGNQQSVHFDYSTDEEQLLAAISQSEGCEQELSYHCRKSRLLNTPGKGCLQLFSRLYVQIFF